MVAQASRTERRLGAALVALALAVLALARALPGPSPADPVGPRGFPVLLALVVAACGVALLFSRPAPDEEAETRGRLAAGPLAAATGLTVAYLAGLEPLGYLVATFLYVAALLLVQGLVSPGPFLAAAIGLPAGLYLLFSGLMGVPLPAGLLEPLVGLLRAGGP